MTRRVLSVAVLPCLVAALCLWLVAAGGNARPMARNRAAANSAANSTSCREATVVSGWSVAQRAQQLLLVSGQFDDLEASTSEAAAGVGGFVLFGQPPAGSGPSITAGIAALVQAARQAGQVVPWMSTDEEGGQVARLADVIGALPSARAMAQMWTPAQVRSALTTHARAMRKLGVTVDLAPVVDTSPASNPIADEDTRSFSDNPHTVTTYGEAFLGGLEAGGVIPVIKHFPGLGHASANTDLGPATDPPLKQLQADDLIPFANAIKAGAPVVMVGHPVVPGLTNGLPASMSSATYRYLRQTLHFNGLAITDSLGAGAILQSGYTEATAAATAVEAGADMVIVDAPDVPAIVAQIQQSVSNGSLPVSVLDSAVGRVLQAKGVNLCRTVAVVARKQSTGYWLTANDGAVQAVGSATTHGGASGLQRTSPIVAMAANPSGRGYWLAQANGTVLAYGNASQYGSITRAGAQVTAMVPSPGGLGYWLVTSSGGVSSFGRARWHGGDASQHPTSPIVAMAANPSGRGYWLAQANGTVLAYGNASPYGSRTHPGAAITGIVATPNGRGYWLVTSSGGISSFGNASWYGGDANHHPNSPIVAIAATPSGRGYWLAQANGTVLAYGNARVQPPAAP